MAGAEGSEASGIFRQVNRLMSPRSPAAQPSPAEPGGDSAADSAVAKLEAHFRTLDETALRRVAQAVELARATTNGDPTDGQILDALRPRLKELRLPRVNTFQRAVCSAIEPFLINGMLGEERRKGAVPRGLLNPWWQLVRASPHATALSGLINSYSAAIRGDKAEAAAALVARGCDLAASATLTTLTEAETSAQRRGEVLLHLGTDRLIPDVRELAWLVSRHAALTPAFDRLRQAAPALVDGQIPEFTPAAVLATRTAYSNLHAADPLLVEYFIIGLLSLLAQPWQALRLVRVLSTDMAKSGEGFLDYIPSRLFADLTRTLTEIGKSVGTEGGMNRRVWLMTCARLLQDAGLMIKGLAEESQADPNPDWKRILQDARQRVMQAVDTFTGAALKHILLVLPEREVKEKDDIRVEPDMTRRPDEETLSTALAAAQLFLTARKLAEQEGHERTFRVKEADLVHRLTIGLNFRIEFLRARGKNVAALGQILSLNRVIATLPRSEAFLELTYKAERAVERYK
jgi:hypothetical protein